MAIVIALTALVGMTSPALADSTTDYGVGVACPGFGLHIESTGSPTVTKDFYDANGNRVRQLTAGKGAALRFSNPQTGATYLLKSNGSVTNTTFNEDGSQTIVTTGHNVLVVYNPDAIPPESSTTLYVGRMVYTVSAGGLFTLQSTSGESTDICAALS
jgi:hypothetical protein